VNATHRGEGSSARCFQTFSGLRTFSYSSKFSTTTGSYITFSQSGTATSTYSEWDTTSATTTAETVFIKFGTLEAKPYVVRFRESDLQTNINSTFSSTSSPTGQTSATGSGNVTTGNDLTSPGLTTGAKAGIGVGAALGALFLVAIGLAVFWIRKKKIKKNDEKTRGTPLWNAEANDVQAPRELPTKWSTAELHAQPMPPKELQVSRYREVNPDDPAELGDVSMSSR
jgi:hypothetical protein